MSQAKTLTPAELDQVLDYISQRSFALRNRVMLLTGMWSGMRVSEIASLSVSDVMWHSPNLVDKYYCQNLNGRNANANAKSQIHS